VYELLDLARVLGADQEDWFRPRIRKCMSRNPHTAEYFIRKLEHRLTLLLMRAAFEQQVPTWPFVEPRNAMTIGLEVTSRKPVHLHKDSLTRGVMIISGGSS
jgi:hypothetical protein